MAWFHRENWRQYLPGTLHLKKGVNEITFRLPNSTVKPSDVNEQLATHIDQGQFMLYSIELGTPKARQAQLQRAKKYQGRFVLDGRRQVWPVYSLLCQYVWLEKRYHAV